MAENPHSPNNSSIVAVRPTTKLVTISTPRALTRSISKSRMSRGRRNSGRPEGRAPPPPARRPSVGVGPAHPSPEAFRHARGPRLARLHHGPPPVAPLDHVGE